MVLLRRKQYTVTLHLTRSNTHNIKRLAISFVYVSLTRISRQDFLCPLQPHKWLKETPSGPTNPKPDSDLSTSSVVVTGEGPNTGVSGCYSLSQLTLYNGKFFSMTMTNEFLIFLFSGVKELIKLLRIRYNLKKGSNSAIEGELNTELVKKNFLSNTAQFGTKWVKTLIYITNLRGNRMRRQKEIPFNTFLLSIFQVLPSFLFVLRLTIFFCLTTYLLFYKSRKVNWQEC